MLTASVLEDAGETGGKDSLQLEFAALSSATDNFSDSNKLGEGGFGAVYKGKLLGGQEIAVKKLSKNSKQGDLEFKNEVLLLSKLQHKNLVRLLGFCLAGVERLLVYELIPNASLDQFLVDNVKRTQLKWQLRYKIIEGIARGLLYLHQDSAFRIIHRDLKASNILLDAEMNPKISDFGMARLFVMDQTQCQTNKIVGTYGYMSPEYAMLGQFSEKSDVYSFGVLVLELITGQLNNCFLAEETGEILFSYVWKKWREGAFDYIIDPVLGNTSRTEVLRCLHIALLCIQENALARPTMAAVVMMLITHSTTLTSPLRPAFLMHTTAQSEASSDYNG
ncbi:unnamed protein product [Rhodiola kirilowii]